jgi:hypothetical protein
LYQKKKIFFDECQQLLGHASMTVSSGWGPLGASSLLLALVLALFPKKLPRAAQREMAAIAAGESVISTKERSFSGKQPALGYHSASFL